MLPSRPPRDNYNLRPGTTIAELQQYVQKDLWTALSTKDVMRETGGMFLMTMTIRATLMSEHPVFTRGSAEDILQGTQVR
jgi:hypothetical protein